MRSQSYALAVVCALAFHKFLTIVGTFVGMMSMFRYVTPSSSRKDLVKVQNMGEDVVSE